MVRRRGNSSMAQVTMSTKIPSTTFEKINYSFLYKLFFAHIEQKPDYLFLHDPKDDGILANFAGVFTFKNDPAFISSRLDEIESNFQRVRRTPVLYTTPDTSPSDLTSYISKRNYSLAFTDAWMFFEKQVSLTLPPSIEVKVVCNIEEMKLYVSLFNQCYSGTGPNEVYGAAPAAWGENLFDSYKNTDPKNEVLHYMLLINGKSVAIAISVSCDDYSGLYSVGTIPSERGKGYGTLITLYAVKALQEKKIKNIFLQTEQGTYNEKLYQKMGFETCWLGKGWVKQNPSS